MAAKGKKRKPARQPRRRLRLASVVSAAVVLLFAAFCDWFVHHPRAWLDSARETLPAFAFDAILRTGNPVGDLTDALDLTGHDVVYDYDTDPPTGDVLFAGEPRRTGPLAPGDITVLDRGEFRVGWSKSLRHPVWAAYHVVAEPRFPSGIRPDFRRDNSVPNCPAAGDYARSGYDRGHMAPNFAITTRYGTEAQKLTFRMSNVAPQTPALNRTVWRDLEHRIANLWTARYGEIWVIVGCYGDATRSETIKGTEIAVPDRFYMIVVAQEGMDVRVLAVDLPQDCGWHEYAARNLVSIDELEERTGFDFLPDLPDFIQGPIEAETPSRLWPIRLRDAFAYLRLLAD